MKIIFGFLFLILSLHCNSQKETGECKFRTLKFIKTHEAVQGVAVSKDFFYTINSRSIGKYDKESGKFMTVWKDISGIITHLDGGTVIGNKLYCAHSNYPGIPMESSVEIFSAKDLKHIGSFSFGDKYGSCTWADFYMNSWWVCFAHYDQFRNEVNKGTESTILVKYDKQWREKESWTFPPELISELRPMSASGGSWGPDGNLYVTGHDSAKVYVLHLPDSGSVLNLSSSCKVDSRGQGIAWDRSDKNRLYGIIRKDNSVVISELSLK